MTVALMLVMGVPLALAGLALAIVLPAGMRSHFDDALETRARALVSLTKVTDGEVEIEFADELMPEFDRGPEALYFELWAGGRQVERSRSFHPSREVAHPDLEQERGVSEEPRFRTVVLPDGRPGRQVQIDFVAEVDDEETEGEEDEEVDDPFEVDADYPDPTEAAAEDVALVIVAAGTDELDAQVAGVRAVTLGGTFVLVGLLALFVRIALAVGLRPLADVTRQVGALDADSLASRVDASGSPEELRPLVGALNGLLSRLESAFRRERQLTGDMAHELKTPVAELRSLCEVGGRWPEHRDAVTAFFADAGEIARQMERIIGNLLELARHDAGGNGVHPVRVHLHEAVERARRPFEAQAQRRGLTWQLDVSPELRATADADKLESILTNLIGNAVAYSRPGTAISCAASESGDDVLLSVSNETEDLESADLEHMFDRFWRKDQARTGGHSVGLGLSVVRALAETMGIEIAPSLDAHGTLRMTLRLPSAPESQGARVASA